MTLSRGGRRAAATLAAVLGTAAAVGVGAPARGADAGRIAPGQSLGPLRLGTSVAALYQTLGQPERTHAAGGTSFLWYGRERVTAVVRENAVVLILTTNPRFRTERGVAVGQPAAALTSVYGTPSPGGDNRILWYDAIGLVAVTGGGTIVRLGVYDPRTFVRAILAEESPARDVFLTAQPARPGKTESAEVPGRVAVFTITLRNASRGAKVLNPNFIRAIDGEGKVYRYDRSTFGQQTPCRSTLVVRPGEAVSCTIVFVLPPDRKVRSLVYEDGASIDEFFL